MAKCNRINWFVAYNKKVSLAAGIVLLICAVALLACAISEFAVGEWPTRGMSFGMVFYNMIGGIYGIVGWKYPTHRWATSNYISGVIGSVFNLLFHTGQIIRIIYLVGFRAYTQNNNIHDPEAAGTILFVELAFLNVALACQVVLAVVGGQAIKGGVKYTDEEQQKAAEAQ